MTREQTKDKYRNTIYKQFAEVNENHEALDSLADGLTESEKAFYSARLIHAMNELTFTIMNLSIELKECEVEAKALINYAFKVYGMEEDIFGYPNIKLPKQDLSFFITDDRDDIELI